MWLYNSRELSHCRRREPGGIIPGPIIRPRRASPLTRNTRLSLFHSSLRLIPLSLTRTRTIPISPSLSGKLTPLKFCTWYSRIIVPETKAVAHGTSCDQKRKPVYYCADCSTCESWSLFDWRFIARFVRKKHARIICVHSKFILQCIAVYYIRREKWNGQSGHKRGLLRQEKCLKFYIQFEVDRNEMLFRWTMDQSVVQVKYMYSQKAIVNFDFIFVRVSSHYALRKPTPLC